MSAWSKVMVAGLLGLGILGSTVDAKDPREIDLSKRQPAPAERRVPMKVQEPKKLEGFTDQRFPITRWHSEFSPIGRRRANIQVQESSDKNLIRPQVMDVPRVTRITAPQSGRLAYVRNFDNVRENRMVPALRDAPVVRLRETPKPESIEEKGEPTMRDINRFTFHRNQYKEDPVRVHQLGRDATSD
jgi:hypothetical protein